jgi:hypothetical protein
MSQLSFFPAQLVAVFVEKVTDCFIVPSVWVELPNSFNILPMKADGIHLQATR